MRSTRIATTLVIAALLASACGGTSTTSAEPGEAPGTLPSISTTNEPVGSDAAPATAPDEPDDSFVDGDEPIEPATGDAEASDTEYDGESGDDTVADEDDDGISLPDVDTMRAAVVDGLASGYERAAGLWPGYVPNEHPAVVPFRTDDGIVGALAINHTGADALGTATELPTAGTPFTSLHRIDDLNDATSDRLTEIPNFDFHAQLGGVDSFVMVADNREAFLNPTNVDWVATFIHELFHRFQDEGFSGSLGNQDVDGYAYTEENLRLAVLEDRALRDTLIATDDDDRLAAARRFAALRLARRDADARVALDDSQEMFEGSARAIEHMQAGDNTEFPYNGTNWEAELRENVTPGSVKDEYGFGRFYASGAAIIRTAQLLGVDDVAERINGGEYPADVVIDAAGVTASDVSGLVAQAEAEYDPSAEIATTVNSALETIDEESSPFDDTGDGDSDAGESFDLTEEQLECLDDNVSDDGLVSAEIWRECVGSD
ncbi:MAG: hypothetical protein AAFP84_04970 [Actinomycetota bacterium]